MMAVFTSVPPFAANIASYGLRVEKASPAAVREAADAAAGAIRQAARPYRIKGRSGRRVKLGVRVSGVQRLGGGGFGALIEASPAGFWKLVQEGAAPHVIRPRRRGRGKTRAALATPYGFFAKVNHPGTGPIGDPWGRGVLIAKRKVPGVYERAYARAFLGLGA
jgi:hypothetical protein